MYKFYIFVNALRLRKEINYPLDNNEENTLSSLVAAKPWIDLVNKYTSNEYENYSIKHMLKMYINGSIKLNIEYPVIHYSFEDVDVYSQRDAANKGILPSRTNPIFFPNSTKDAYSMTTLSDDRVYDKVSLWYLALEGEVIVIEMLLCSGNSMYSIIIGDMSRGMDMYYVSLVFNKLFMTNFEYDILYRIQPKTIDPGVISTFCTGSIEDIRLKLNLQEEDLGDCVRYSVDGNWLRELTWEELKGIYA